MISKSTAQNCAAALVLLFMTAPLEAAGVSTGPLAVSNLTVTSSTLSFDITGQIVGASLPQANKEFIFITTGLDGVDFLSGFDIVATATGGLGNGVSLNSNSYFVENGETSFGDRISIGFNRALVVGDSINGSITLTARATIINEQAFQDHGFAVHWGRANADNITSPYTGNFQSAGNVVPEPSAALLSLVGLLAILRRRR